MPESMLTFSDAFLIPRWKIVGGDSVIPRELEENDKSLQRVIDQEAKNQTCDDLFTLGKMG